MTSSLVSQVPRVKARKDVSQCAITSVKEGLITIDLRGVPRRKNEVGHILLGDRQLMAEILRIRGDSADMQVFEDTTGVKVGDVVEMTGNLLSAQLGPGLLGQVYDGLQNPLSVLAKEFGFFLPRGVQRSALDEHRKWEFTPKAKVGDICKPGQSIGHVVEGRFAHQIMIPFDEPEPRRMSWIRSGSFTVQEPVARIETGGGDERTLCLTSFWPVRKAIPTSMIVRRFAKREYPHERLETTQRIIDTFFPIARGGTACIPGPFGAGKTVLQSLIARFSSVDIVIIIACGERAGEVVETIKEYPQAIDPQTGGSLMDRTIIICNTSSMPVAARESSIYTGITLAEYYRQMGYNVLCIADSTSRWAQALRETSGRMEEIPGEEAFPASLDSSIKGIYERAGVIRTPDEQVGSLTLIGTVSPAGGNFDEPVTQSTLASVKTFLGLSSERAYRRFYPAIDPLLSWSRYLLQLGPWITEHLGPTWTRDVEEMMEILRQGQAISQMVQVIGEEGITLEDFVNWQKAVLIDMVYLQQDAFDSVDSSMPLKRQVESFGLLRGILRGTYNFADKENAREFFTKLTGLYKNFNYSAPQSPEFEKYQRSIDELVSGARLSQTPDKTAQTMPEQPQ